MSQLLLTVLVDTGLGAWWNTVVLVAVNKLEEKIYLYIKIYKSEKKYNTVLYIMILKKAGGNFINISNWFGCPKLCTVHKGISETPASDLH